MTTTATATLKKVYTRQTAFTNTEKYPKL